MDTRLTTVIGGSGFLGRYIVQALLKSGGRVRVACRDPREAWFLKAQAGLGQIQFAAVDIKKADSVARAVAGSHAVVNLVGVLKGDFQGLQVNGARHAAEAAQSEGATAFVQMSAIGADPGSASAYGRSKGDGESAVHTAFPNATILRPSIVFGREDQFINRFAGLISMLPVVPVVRATAKFQPVYVGDVAQAVEAVIADPQGHGGQIYELGGPEVLSMIAINRWIANAIGRSPLFVSVPDIVAGAMARGTGWMPGAPITDDQYKMLASDNVVTGIDGLAALGITPTPLDAVGDEWLVKYRRHGRFTKYKG